jgi:hypothetical protein
MINNRDAINVGEAFIEDNFEPAEKKILFCCWLSKARQRHKIIAVADAFGLAFAAQVKIDCLQSKLAEDTINMSFVDHTPRLSLATWLWISMALTITLNRALAFY